MHPSTLRLLPALWLLAAPSPSFAQELDARAPLALDAGSFAELRELVLPSAEELAWKDRGWRASLWEGVIEAQAAEKPVLLWAMNGHPLGCT